MEAFEEAVTVGFASADQDVDALALGDGQVAHVDRDAFDGSRGLGALNLALADNFFAISLLDAQVLLESIGKAAQGSLALGAGGSFLRPSILV